MSLNTISDMQRDESLLRRVVACVAQEGEQDPEGWTAQRTCILAATPGWADKYASAQLSGHQQPGCRTDVITDGDILARVQGLRAA